MSLQVRQFQSQEGPEDGEGRESRPRSQSTPSPKALAQRRSSLESSDEKVAMTQRRRKKESFYPRRRFSYSAIEPIREILEEIEEEEKAAWEKVGVLRDRQCAQFDEWPRPQVRGSVRH